LTSGRIGIAAQAVGILAACLDASVKFAKERSAFGRPIGAFEGISFKIARMATDLDAARLLVYRAAALADAGKPFAVEASKAKLFASTAARVHASEALQIHGGYGYTTEFPSRALLPRREDHRDLRGDVRSSAADHRAQFARPARRVMTARFPLDSEGRWCSARMLSRRSTSANVRSRRGALR
jgi:alkylation response protein AidB-like acyl-CoA dehydrogenase